MCVSVHNDESASLQRGLLDDHRVPGRAHLREHQPAARAQHAADQHRDQPHLRDGARRVPARAHGGGGLEPGPQQLVPAPVQAGLCQRVHVPAGEREHAPAPSPPDRQSVSEPLKQIVRCTPLTVMSKLRKKMDPENSDTFCFTQSNLICLI